jgi:hypothetical protein
MTARTYTLLGSDRQPHQSATPGALGGHRPSRVYGRLECPAALRAIARGGYVRNRVFFADEQTAVAAGYGYAPYACATSTSSGRQGRIPGFLGKRKGLTAAASANPSSSMVSARHCVAAPSH